MNRFARVAAILAAAGLAAVSSAEAKKKKPPAPPPCVTGVDETALQMRTVQTELMVAALSCQQTANYNAFVTGNQKTLQGAHGQLQKFFKSHGGEKALNAFITKLANDSSKRSVGDIASFCEQNTYLYQAILDPKRIDLATFIQPLWVAQLHGFASCTPKTSYIIYGPKGPIAVQPPASISAASPPAAAPPAPGSTPQADTSGIPTPKPKPASITQG